MHQYSAERRVAAINHRNDEEELKRRDNPLGRWPPFHGRGGLKH